MKKPNLLTRILCYFFAVQLALPPAVLGQVLLEPPILLNSNTLRLVVDGPTTNIRYDVYGTNAIGGGIATWPLLITGQTNQVIFDFTMPWTNAGFFVVTSNYVAGDQPPPQVATPIFTPPSASGNASVQVTVTCDTPGAVIYYTLDGNTPTTSDTYIPNGGKVTIQCATTLKARAFRSGFVDSEVATGVFAVNCPPEVFAGSQQIIFANQTTLEGYVTDDGLSQAVSNHWQKVSGPGTVTFGNVNVTNTTATFSQEGIYVLRLSVFDGFWTTASEVTIAWNPAINVALTAPAPSSVFNVPTNIALSAAATTTSGSITQVQFYAGSLLIGTDTTEPFTYEWRNVPAGDHALFAVATSDDPAHLRLQSEPVNITVNFPTDLGRFTLAASDLTIPVAGLSIRLNRSHDPRHGSGWSLGENMRFDHEAVSIAKTAPLGSGYTALRTFGQDCIVPNHDTLVTVAFGPTEIYYFRPRIVFQAGGGNPCVGSSSVTYLANIRFEFEAVGPLGGQLAAFNAPGDVGMMNDNALFGSWSGAIEAATEDFFDIEPWEPDWSFFTFTAPDGTQYKFDGNGKLYQQIDRNNNALTFDWSGIYHSSGKQISFTRDGWGRVTEVYDPIALASSGVPAIKYDYDDSGNLTNVARLVNRAGAGTYEHTGYRYDDGSFPSLITRVIDARGVTTVSNVFDGFGRLTRQYDAVGNYTSFDYEDNGRRQIVTDRNGKTARQEFTEAGQLASAQDAEGAVTRYEYDANGRPIAQIDPLGGVSSFAYNERDELVGLTNELNFTSSSTYGNFGLPLIIVDSAGHETQNEYDAAGNLLFTTNALGVVSAYGYDFQGNRIAETNALGLAEETVTLHDFNEFGYVTTVTDALGFQTAFIYDENGNMLTTQRERTLPGGGTQTLWSTNIYDAQNRVIAVIEPDGFTNQTVFNAIGQTAFTTNKLGIVTKFDYDARGLLTNTVFALGTAQQASEQTSYDAESRRTNQVDRAGRATSYTYDGLGRLKRTTFPDGGYMENQYDAGGRLLATIQGPRPPGGFVPSPSGFTTRYGYDAVGRRVAVTNALGEVARFAYDANGNQTNVVDALGRTNRFVFDALNRQTQTFYPDGTSESTGYDALDRKITSTNQAGIITRFGFDALGRLTVVTNAFGTAQTMATRYVYDEAGNLLQQIDGLNRTNRFEYDALGRRTKETLPGAQAQTFGYDAVGNLTRLTNFNGSVITNQFDVLNRLTNKASINGYQIRFAYSPTGQRTTMVDASGTNTYTYDLRDRLLTKTTPQGTLAYVYDLFGNLQSIESSTANGARLTYSYDALNRLTNVVDRFANNTFYTFDGVGNLQTLRYQNNVTNTYAYNALNRLTNITARSAAGTIASFAYRLAPAGNRTNLMENINGTLRTNVWAYDPLYRLTNEVITGASPVGGVSYRYDAVGNRTNRTSSVSGVGNQTFTYNGNDWLATDTYDNNGSTTASGGIPYAYDVENRLTNYNSGAVTFVYDGDGYRVRKTVSGVTTFYLVDDRNPTGYAQVLEERTSTATNLYAYGLDLISQRQSDGTTHFYGYDGNGNVRYLTAANATVSDTYAYDAFGIQITSTGSTPNNYRYSGEQFDPNLGFYYLRARYLNPGTGRFWTRDTLAGSAFDPSSLHRYTYCSADPINRFDPSGHMSLGGTISVGGIWGGLAGSLLPAINTAYMRMVAKITIATIATATLSGDRVNFPNAMRLQLQEGTDFHYWSATIPGPSSGVTRKEVQLALHGMWSALQILSNTSWDNKQNWDKFKHFSRWEAQLWSAVIRMSSWVGTHGPTANAYYTVHQEYGDPTDFTSPRIDLENLRGVNLNR